MIDIIGIVIPAQCHKHCVYKKRMPRSKEDLKDSFKAWCHTQFHEQNFGNHCSVKRVVRKILNIFTNDESQQHFFKGLLASFQNNQQRESAYGLMDKVYKYLSKKIKREYEKYCTSKNHQNLCTISDESNESSTKPHPKITISISQVDFITYTSTLGHPIFGDKIAAVSELFYNEMEGFVQQRALVEWKPRKNGTIPQKSILCLGELLYFKPNLFQDPSIFKSNLTMQKFNRLQKILKQKRIR